MRRPALQAVLDEIDTARRHPGSFSGLATGIPSLDRRLRGLRGLTLVGARPSMGKTTFLQTVAANICETAIQSRIPLAVGFLTAEMSEKDLLRRWLCMLAGVRSEDIDLGNLTDVERSAVAHAALKMDKWPLLLRGISSPTPYDVQSCIANWAMEAQGTLGLIIVDHLGEIVSPGGGQFSEYRAANEAIDLLRDATVELGVPVLAAAQLNRRVEERENKRPQLSDLRDSGRLEEKASTALLLYRRAYYDAQQTGLDVGTAPLEIIVAKGRNVGVGTAFVDFVPDIPRLDVAHSQAALPVTI